MVIAPLKGLAYEAYLAEGESKQRYEIIDGERIFRASLIEDHRIYSGNLYFNFRMSEQTHRAGKALYAPIIFS